MHPGQRTRPPEEPRTAPRNAYRRSIRFRLSPPRPPSHSSASGGDFRSCPPDFPCAGAPAPALWPIAAARLWARHQDLLRSPVRNRPPRTDARQPPKQIPGDGFGALPRGEPRTCCANRPCAFGREPWTFWSRTAPRCSAGSKLYFPATASARNPRRNSHPVTSASPGNVTIGNPRYECGRPHPNTPNRRPPAPLFSLLCRRFSRHRRSRRP